MDDEMEVLGCRELLYPVFSLLKSNGKLVKRSALYGGLVSMGLHDKYDDIKEKGKESVLKTNMGFSLSWLKKGKNPIADNPKQGHWCLTAFGKSDKCTKEYIENVHAVVAYNEIKAGSKKTRDLKAKEMANLFDMGKKPRKVKQKLQEPIEFIKQEKPQTKVLDTDPLTLVTAMVEGGVIDKSKAYEAILVLSARQMK